MQTEKRSLSEWASVIATMQESGLPQKKWCEKQSINYFSLRNAQVRLKKQKHLSTKKAPSFIGVEVTSLANEVSFTCGSVTLNTSTNDAVTILRSLSIDAPC
jgi:hypothetical protein